MSKTENATEATREPPAVPAVGSQVDLVLGPRPPERAAFEAWLNPGHYADNISPWVAPGRYKSDRHQMAWLGWQAGVAAERERICAAIKAEDDHCADRDYMLDSDDCIAVARGQWRVSNDQPCDVAKETNLWRCTVCGRIGTVGRCCGEETREPVRAPKTT